MRPAELYSRLKARIRKRWKSLAALALVAALIGLGCGPTGLLTNQQCIAIVEAAVLLLSRTGTEKSVPQKKEETDTTSLTAGH